MREEEIAIRNEYFTFWSRKGWIINFLCRLQCRFDVMTNIRANVKKKKNVSYNLSHDWFKNILYIVRNWLKKSIVANLPIWTVCRSRIAVPFVASSRILQTFTNKRDFKRRTVSRSFDNIVHSIICDSRANENNNNKKERKKVDKIHAKVYNRVFH